MRVAKCVRFFSAVSCGGAGSAGFASLESAHRSAHAQAKELLDHLESLMIGEAIEVVSGHQYVEVKPRGLSKGTTVKHILADVAPDFVVCLGDDKSDEEMFHTFIETHNDDMTVFACTVGQKPSQAAFYVNDNKEVVALLSRLADESCTAAQ